MPFPLCCSQMAFTAGSDKTLRSSEYFIDCLADPRALLRP